MEHPQHKQINGFSHIRYQPLAITKQESGIKSEEFLHLMHQRRSVREFSSHPIDKKIIETILKTASTAPSGAHKQPWTFCAIQNSALKTKIRLAAEQEERENYSTRMSERWKADLAPFGTNSNKQFLEIAPWLIVVFKQSYGFNQNEEKEQHYYVNESVGIACGLLITAIHTAGLVTLTHTPSPMNFLSKLLDRPSNEKPFLLLPVGYPANPAYVPNIKRKPLEEIAVFYE